MGRCSLRLARLSDKHCDVRTSRCCCEVQQGYLSAIPYLAVLPRGQGCALIQGYQPAIPYLAVIHRVTLIQGYQSAISYLAVLPSRVKLIQGYQSATPYLAVLPRGHSGISISHPLSSCVSPELILGYQSAIPYLAVLPRGQGCALIQGYQSAIPYLAVHPRAHSGISISHPLSSCTPQSSFRDINQPPPIYLYSSEGRVVHSFRDINQPSPI